MFTQSYLDTVTGPLRTVYPYPTLNYGSFKFNILTFPKVELTEQQVKDMAEAKPIKDPVLLPLPICTEDSLSLSQFEDAFKIKDFTASLPKGIAIKISEIADGILFSVYEETKEDSNPEVCMSNSMQYICKRVGDKWAVVEMLVTFGNQMGLSNMSRAAGNCTECRFQAVKAAYTAGQRSGDARGSALAHASFVLNTKSGMLAKKSMFPKAFAMSLPEVAKWDSMSQEVLFSCLSALPRDPIIRAHFDKIDAFVSLFKNELQFFDFLEVAKAEHLQVQYNNGMGGLQVFNRAQAEGTFKWLAEQTVTIKKRDLTEEVRVCDFTSGQLLACFTPERLLDADLFLRAPLNNTTGVLISMWFKIYKHVDFEAFAAPRALDEGSEDTLTLIMAFTRTPAVEVDDAVEATQPFEPVAAKTDSPEFVTDTKRLCVEDSASGTTDRISSRTHLNEPKDSEKSDSA